MTAADPILAALAVGKARLRQGWTKGAFCRDGRGESHCVFFGDAVSWCAVGAIGFVESAAQTRAICYLTVAAKAAGYGTVPELNDAPATELRHVLGLYDWAEEPRRIDLGRGK